MLSEKIWKIAAGAAGASLLLHIVSGAWAYLFGASLFVGVVAYLVYKYGDKVS